MSDIFRLAGIITWVISLMGTIYLLGYWKGGVDAFIRQAQECNNKYPPAELGLQVKTFWQIYSVEALRQKPELTEGQGTTIMGG